MTGANYFSAFDHEAALADHPIGPGFAATFTGMSRDELRARQERLFSRAMARAWAVPFYQRHWGKEGIEPGDIAGLDDIGKLPPYDKSDIMASIETHPPFGDFHGLETYEKGTRPPVIFHTTSGTTGRPQVLLFGARSREIQNMLLARMYLFQGIGEDDIVHSVYGHGMINGGHYVRESFVHWTPAIFMSAGTGIETRSVQQVNLMKDFGATAIVGFADYIKKLADVAREEGIEPGRDIHIRKIIGHLGREDKEALSRAWGGAECYDWYGVGDTGIIAGEGPDRSGMYVQEDAQYLEILDLDSGAPVGDGQSGDMVCTCLYKDDVYPIIRFNTHDVSAFKTEASPIGLSFRRIEGFLGRSDNMVKLRGINIFPQGIGPMLEEHPAFAGEFICKAVRDAQGRDEFIVLAEVREGDAAEIERDFRAILKRKVGIEVAVELARPGELSALTQIETRQKPIRLIDERFK